MTAAIVVLAALAGVGCVLAVVAYVLLDRIDAGMDTFVANVNDEFAMWTATEGDAP